MRFYWLILLALAGSSGCVYFNTFYNAQKYFRQAEKERRVHEEQHASWELEEGATEAYQVPRPQKADQLYDQAARKASRVLEDYKESELVDDAMFLMGRSFYWRGEYLRAVQSFRDLEVNFPASEYFNRARYWRALCMEEQRVYDQAQQVYRALFEEAEEDVAALAGWRLGEIAFQTEDYIAAVQEYQSALDAFPGAKIRAGLWLNLGSALLALDDSTRYQEAEQAFREALREGPDRDQKYRALLNGGRVRYLLGDVEGALDVYEDLLADGGFRAYEGRTRLLIGAHYQQARDLERALVEYEQVRDDFPLSPASAMALYRTGLLYLQDRGDIELARDYFEETNREKSGSQGARLAQTMQGYLTRLQGLQGQVHRADSLAADSLDAVAGPIVWSDDWQPPNGREAEDELEVSEQREIVVSTSLEVLDDLFTIAEVYRDFVGQTDSSLAYYREIIRRFPTSEQLPRALYSIAWIHREMGRDEDAARPYLDRLIKDFSTSVHANEARALLGQELLITDSERAAAAFSEIEAVRLKNPQSLADYVPLLDSLASRYSGSSIGARALYVSAVAYENLRGDSLEAEKRFQRLEEEFAETEYGELALQRREARSGGTIAKLQRSLKGIGGVLKPGEEIALLALEPDTLDSVSEARKYMGFALRAQRRGDDQGARAYYERSLEEQLKNPRALYLLGNLSWEEGFFPEAIELYRQTLAFDPNYLQAYYRLYGAFIAEAEEDSANAYLQHLLRRDAGNPQVRYAREQYPTLGDGETLEIEQLEELGLAAKGDDLRWDVRDVSLGDAPLVRTVVTPNAPRAGSIDSLTVLVDVLIDKRGQAERVEVFSGQEPYAQAAIDAAFEYQFYPALRTDGKEVKVWVELAVPFLPNAQAAVDTTRGNISPTTDEGT